MKERGPKELSAHRGMATRGGRFIPLDDFRRAVAASGRSLPRGERQAATRRFLARESVTAPMEGPYNRIAVFGGIYSNHLALAALLEDVEPRQVDALYCLGDLGGFGPHPEKVWPLLKQGSVRSIQGNYEESLASGREDCNCGYTDPRDNHFARISYRYTAERCSPEFKDWMGALPMRRRVRVGERELLLVHGSPRRINEFLFHSTSPVPFLEVLLDQHHCDGILCTHSGLQWHRNLPSGRDVINVGAAGRPANDGKTNVWYAVVEDRGKDLGVELIPLDYDHQSLVTEMRSEGLPEEFAETISGGWWTTCLEILPARERQRSRY